MPKNPGHRSGCAALAVLCLTILSTPAAWAQRDTWSFQHHPHPTRAELTEHEELLYDGPVRSGESDDRCVRDIQRNLTIYRSRYPEFGKSDQPDVDISAWKVHFVQTATDYVIVCFVVGSGLSLSAIDSVAARRFEPRPEFYFCGQFSRPPETPQEHEISLLVNEIFGYAKLLRESPVNSLMIGDAGRRSIELNADIGYYFEKFKKQYPDLPYLEPELEQWIAQLSPARIAFVDAAGARGDLDAVIETTAPCPPRKS